MSDEVREARALARAIQAERLERATAEVERLRDEVRRLLDERDEARASVVDLRACVEQMARALRGATGG